MPKAGQYFREGVKKSIWKLSLLKTWAVTHGNQLMSSVLEGGRLTDLSAFRKRRPSCSTNMSQGSSCTREAREVLPGDPSHQNQLAANAHGKTALICLQDPWWCEKRSYPESFWWEKICTSVAMAWGVSDLSSSHQRGLLACAVQASSPAHPFNFHQKCACASPSPPNTLHFQINFKSNLFNIELFLICIVTSS